MISAVGLLNESVDFVYILITLVCLLVFISLVCHAGEAIVMLLVNYRNFAKLNGVTENTVHSD